MRSNEFDRPITIPLSLPIAPPLPSDLPLVPPVPVPFPVTSSGTIAPPPKKGERGSKRLQPLILPEDVCRALARTVGSAPSPEAAIIHLMHLYDFDLILLNQALESNSSSSPFTFLVSDLTPIQPQRTVSMSPSRALCFLRSLLLSVLNRQPNSATPTGSRSIALASRTTSSTRSSTISTSPPTFTVSPGSWKTRNVVPV